MQVREAEEVRRQRWRDEMIALVKKEAEKLNQKVIAWNRQLERSERQDCQNHLE